MKLLCFKTGIRLILIFLFHLTVSSAYCNVEESVLASIDGTIWVETDGNSMFNGEFGADGVVVELLDFESLTLVASTNSIDGSFTLNDVAAGKYILSIPGSQFGFGAPLEGLFSCSGTNDPNDMVDNDDNGEGEFLGPVRTAVFTVSDENANNNETIEYIDFCFFETCNEANPLASNSCSEISNLDVICNVETLGNFCNIMPSTTSPGIQPSPICSQTDQEAENISWFAFKASEGSYSIEIVPSNCTSGSFGLSGIQVGIYTDCSFENSVFCDANCFSQSITIPSTNLTPGEEYYLFIDGCDGSICNYEINILGNPTIPDLAPEKLCVQNNGALVCDSIQYCIGKEAVFMTNEVSINAIYDWSITTLSGAVYSGDSLQSTNENSIGISFNNNGRYEVCLTQIDNGCSLWLGSVCQRIEISSNIDVVSDEFFSPLGICIDEDPTSIDLAVLANQDPNSDGVFGWQGSASDFALGINNITVPTENCTYDQTVTISNYPINDQGLISEILCENDFPFNIGGLVITEEDFMGDFTLTMNDVLLDEADHNGCDSIVDIELERLIVNNGGIVNQGCTFDGIVLDFEFETTTSTNLIFLSFEWTDPSGNIVPDNLDPFDPTNTVIPSESGSGTYTLEVTINKSGGTCTHIYMTDISFEDQLPDTPTIQGPSVTCDGNITTHTAVNGTFLSFIWTYPDDVEATLSGPENNTLMINWFGSQGGEITLQSEDLCGFSEIVSTTVTVNPSSTIEISTSEELICIEDAIMVSFNSNQFLNAEWDFGGATIISGMGLGPYMLRWNTPGVKEITLNAISTNGCPGIQDVVMIEVREPVLEPFVTCQSTINEVTFSWVNDPLVENFEVEVLSGQSGMFTSNSVFTVGGLEPGNTVTIRVTAIPLDKTCGNVSTETSCIAIDCPPAIITLEAEQDEICLTGNNETITITASIDINISGEGVFIGPGIVNGSGVFDPNVANIGSNAITYSLISDDGCSYFQNINIEVFEKPVADFSFVEDTICISDNALIQFTGTPNSDTFEWQFDGGNGNPVPNPSVSFSSTGIKTISLAVTKDGCTSDVVSKSLLVVEELEPITLTCIAGEGTIEFIWDAIAGASQYEVAINGNNPITIENLNIIVTDLGSDEVVDISITAISDGPCDNVSSDLSCIALTTSIEEKPLVDVKAFPNPVSSLLYLEGVPSSVQYKLVNLTGKALETGVFVDHLDVSKYHSGVYFLILTNDTERYITRFVKQ